MEVNCKEKYHFFLFFIRKSSPIKQQTVLLFEQRGTKKKAGRCSTLPPLCGETSAWCVYDKDHLSVLRIKNTSGSDPLSYEVSLKQLYNVQIKPRKNWEPQNVFLGFICNCLSYFITARITSTGSNFQNTSSTSFFPLWHSLLKSSKTSVIENESKTS